MIVIPFHGSDNIWSLIHIVNDFFQIKFRTIVHHKPLIYNKKCILRPQKLFTAAILWWWYRRAGRKYNHVRSNRDISAPSFHQLAADAGGASLQE